MFKKKTDEIEREVENSSFCFTDNKSSPNERVVWWFCQLLTFPAQSRTRNWSVWTSSDTLRDTVISSETVPPTNHWTKRSTAWFFSGMFFTYAFSWHLRIWANEDHIRSFPLETARQPHIGNNSSKTWTLATSNSLRDCDDMIPKQTFAIFPARKIDTLFSLCSSFLASLNIDVSLPFSLSKFPSFDFVFSHDEQLTRVSLILHFVLPVDFIAESSWEGFVEDVDCNGVETICVCCSYGKHLFSSRARTWSVRQQVVGCC